MAKTTKTAPREKKVETTGHSNPVEHGEFGAEFMTDGRALFIVIAATVLVFANSLSGQFVFDDTTQILGNPTIHSWTNILHAFTRDVWDFQRATITKNIPPPYYRPIFTVYLTVGYQLFGTWASGWHLMNLAVHCGATSLVYFLLRRLSGSVPIAAFAALCFGLHPAHVESVSWISGIPDPLAALFFIPSMIWYIKYREDNQTKWLFLSLAFFGLGALCKETALSLPMVIFVWELVRSKQPFGARLTPAVKAILPYAGVGVLYLIARYAVLGMLSRQHPMMTTVSDSSVLMTIPYVVVTYIKHLVAPYRLSLIYGATFVESVSDARFLFSAGLLLAFAVLLWVKRRQISAEVWMGLVLFVAPLLPVLNLRVFHFEYIIQDRYLYLPSIGFCFLLALLVARIAKSSLNAAIVLAVLVAAGFGITTVYQNRVWHDPIALWQRAVEYSPESWSMHYNLGLAWLDARQFSEARRELSEAQKLGPNEPTVYNNLALAEAGLNDTDGAVTHLKRALALDPAMTEAHNNLGTVLYTRQDYSGASTEFKKALQGDPNSLSAHFNLARSMAAMGDHTNAVQEYRSAILLDPSDTAAHYQLGLSLAVLNKKSEAIAEIETAIKLRPNSRDLDEMKKKLDELHASK